MKKNRIFKKVSIAMIIFSIVLSGVVFMPDSRINI